jgi:hypothetical protein
MFVVSFPGLQQLLLILFPGRDHDYQTLNLTFAVNVVKFGLIIGMFPRPLKLCVLALSVTVSRSLFPFH